MAAVEMSSIRPTPQEDEVIRAACPNATEWLLNLREKFEWKRFVGAFPEPDSHRFPTRNFCPSTGEYGFFYRGVSGEEAIAEKCANDLGLALGISVPGCLFSEDELGLALVSRGPGDFAPSLDRWIRRMKKYGGDEEAVERKAAELFPLEEFALSVWLDNWDRPEKNYVVAGTHDSDDVKIYGVDYGNSFGGPAGWAGFAQNPLDSQSAFVKPECVRKYSEISDSRLGSICLTIASFDKDLLDAIIMRPFRALGINETLGLGIASRLLERRMELKALVVKLWDQI